MWKIERLYLKNFIHVYSGLQKTEIELDLTNTPQKINIFIGKMGSGKSAILGHLQPFSTYGTLDVRHQDKMIIPGENGIKNIIFTKGPTVYDITHQYTWNPKMETHNTKSYFKMDGIEMNENGNSNSFKDLVKAEFGIDQNFLRLLRLGPNVSNLINMRSTERKSFIASLLQDSEVYGMLHGKLTVDYRNSNSMITVLSNKLLGLSADKENEIHQHAETLTDRSETLSKELKAYQDSIAFLNGETSANLDGMSIAEAEAYLDKIYRKHTDLRLHIDDIKEKLSYVEEDDASALSVEYGKTLASIDANIESIMEIERELVDVTKHHSALQERVLLNDNADQLAMVRKSHSEITARYENAKSSLDGFKTSYTYSYLVGFLVILKDFQMMMDGITANDVELVGKLYKSDKSIIPWCRKKINILNATHTKLLKQLANTTYSGQYSCQIPLFRPPNCPTETCPYLITHPETIRSKNREEAITAATLNSEISGIERSISNYQNISEQYPRMQLLKKSWESISIVLSTAGALNCPDLYTILTNIRYRIDWYDHDALVDYTERVKTFEDFAAIQNLYYQSSNDLHALQSSNIESDKVELSKMLTAKEGYVEELDYALKRKEELADTKNMLEIRINALAAADMLKSDLTASIAEFSVLDAEVISLTEKIDRAKDVYAEISIKEKDLRAIRLDYEDTVKKVNSARDILRDIKSAKESYSEAIEQRNTIKLILDSVSSKDGIPLILIKLFLDECREIMNDLIYDIFNDGLEIVDFQISEETNEFKIPFISNGVYIDDIESASQGQQAIISIALSFAICRKSMFDYNIPLLDEVDNSIYRHDREKFIDILFKQMVALGSKQVFMITHNDIFQSSGLPVNIIMTTPEVIDPGKNQSTIQL